ncbi:DUF2897 family protein [Psychromonas sp.]|uniref:DUF2897 family protein n=1 Tax=Psychromonas sp. TaxID=1884585 RepID=UPI00356A2109
MNGWAVTLLIALVLGVIVSNLMLLKHTAKMKVPKEILDAIQKKKEKAIQEEKQKKKPNDE